MAQIGPKDNTNPACHCPWNFRGIFTGKCLANGPFCASRGGAHCAGGAARSWLHGNWPLGSKSKPIWTSFVQVVLMGHKEHTTPKKSMRTLRKIGVPRPYICWTKRGRGRREAPICMSTAPWPLPLASTLAVGKPARYDTTISNKKEVRAQPAGPGLSPK